MLGDRDRQPGQLLYLIADRRPDRDQFTFGELVAGCATHLAYFVNVGHVIH